MYNPSSSQQWDTVTLTKGGPHVKQTHASSFKQSNNEDRIDSILAGSGGGGGTAVLNTVGKEFGKKVLNFRLLKKMKQSELASAINIPMKDLVDIEKGTYIKNGASYNKVTRYMNKESQKK